MKEETKRKEKSGLRGISRFCALQNLYQSEFENVAGISPKEGISEAVLTESISLSDMDKKFLKELLDKTQQNLLEIDKVIENHLSKNWTIDRLDPVVKCILRLGITELLFFKNIPSNVVFNEYIEIAKAFLDIGEVSFINGLLNKVEKSVRKD
ncbi:MAG: transcription antitermination factor NusB [Alphaproteobacteria bacterium]|nr:transcription antitermination factor NusB [Alphaproteobacteria bacterium]